MDNLREQMAYISKAGAYDALVPHVKELKEIIREMVGALEMEMWAEMNGEATAQKEGKPRLITRMEIMETLVKKAKLLSI
jgi:hypothetical protein